MIKTIINYCLYLEHFLNILLQNISKHDLLRLPLKFIAAFSLSICLCGVLTLLALFFRLLFVLQVQHTVDSMVD